MAAGDDFYSQEVHRGEVRSRCVYVIQPQQESTSSALLTKAVETPFLTTDPLPLFSFSFFLPFSSPFPFTSGWFCAFLLPMLCAQHSKIFIFLLSVHIPRSSGPMDKERRFQNVHLIASGGMSYIYEVGPGIVVKVPQTEDFARQQFCNELEIYKTLSRNLAACEFIVQCFYYTDDGVFLEHMRGKYYRGL